jgi:hypothetical protein
VDGHAGDVVVQKLDLARVETDAAFETDLSS